MIPYLIIIISLIFDGILSNFINYIPYDLSIFTPMFTIVSIFIIYPFYKKSEENYYINLIILGLLYDLFYTNIYFLNSILFVIIGYISKIIYKNLTINIYNIILYSILIISIYELSTAFVLLVLNIVPVSINKILYKISNSILLNIIYSEILYLFIKIIPQKYKKTNIN